MPQKKTVFVLGNPLVKEDSIAISAAKLLEKKFSGIFFQEIDSIDSIKKFPKNIVLMDAVAGVEKVCVISDLKRICGNDVFSLHDLDAGFQLKLFKKMGKIGEVKIIAIPQKMELGNAVESVSWLLKKKQKMLF